MNAVGMRSNVAWGGLAAAAAAVCGIAVGAAPQVFLVIPVALAVLALRWPAGRVAWLVLGGMVVLQSSSGISAPKLAYLAGVVVSFFVAWARLRAFRQEPWIGPFRLALRGAWLLAGLLVIWSVVGLRSGASQTDVLRDALTYALIAVGPLIAADAAASMRLRSADTLVMLVALLATTGFAVAWISRRGVSQLDTQQFILASTPLMAIGVALAATRGLIGSRIRWSWLLAIPVIISGQLVTGTRTGLVLVFGLLGVVGARKKKRASFGRTAFATVATVVGLIALLPLLSSHLTSTSFFDKRLAAAQQVFTLGWNSDQSGAIRLIAQGIATRTWEGHHLLGVGFGHAFPNPNDQRTVALYQIDTPVLLVAKFGILGGLLLLICLALVFSPVRTATRVLGEHIPEQAVMRGFIAIELGVFIFGLPTEDKGFALSIPLLLLLVGCSLRERLTFRATTPAEPNYGSEVRH